MAWCLSIIKPLPEPVLTYCQLDNLEHISAFFSSKIHIFIEENVWKYCLKNTSHFFQASMCWLIYEDAVDKMHVTFFFFFFQNQINDTSVPMNFYCALHQVILTLDMQGLNYSISA